MFDKILIANRGEIACRIIETAHKLGISCVAIFSDADKKARHVCMADEAFHMGPSPSKDSYLRTDKILDAAKRAGVQAIHPGYGFLSENAEFAKACAQQEVVFIGPPVAAIEAMGSKSAAKEIMGKADVPLVPGYHGDDQDPAYLKEQSKLVGYPQILKAALGGGGKGMRVINSEAEFDAALAATKREATASFGDDKLLIERYLSKPRHIEVQVFADKQGRCIYLGDRDCSIQRRHQKVIEEAPAPNLPDHLRKTMGEAAVAAASAINYEGAGTVEFLLDEDGTFCFLEMNTRLQVEHPVTEMVTGQDLVAWQLAVANGEPLSLTQDQVCIKGHALEVRVYAEDPDNDFLPATGKLSYLRQPETSPQVRVDTGIRENDEVSSFYDPMIAKLITWGQSRDASIKQMLNALENYRIGGLTTNLGFLTKLIENSHYTNAELDTGFIQRYSKQLLNKGPGLDRKSLAYAALAVLLNRKRKSISSYSEHQSPWDANDGWRLNENPSYQVQLTDSGGEDHTIHIFSLNSVYRIVIDDTTLDLEAELSSDQLTINIQGYRRIYYINHQSDTITLFKQHHALVFTIKKKIFESFDNEESEGNLAAPMNGTLVSVLIKAGDKVKLGDTLVVMEAMKMEYSIKAPYDGQVTAVFYSEGDLIKDGEQLIELEPEN